MEVHIVIIQYENSFDTGIEIIGVRKDYNLAKQLVQDCLPSIKEDYGVDRLFDDNGEFLENFANDENVIYDVQDDSIYIADHWRDSYVSVNIFTENLI